MKLHNLFQRLTALSLAAILILTSWPAQASSTALTCPTPAASAVFTSQALSPLSRQFQTEFNRPAAVSQIRLIENAASSAGSAMRASGKGLTSAEHAVVNQVIQQRYASGKIKPRPVAADTFSRLDPEGELAKRGIRILQVDHLIRDLIEAGKAAGLGRSLGDLIAHPGFSRNVLYIDMNYLRLLEGSPLDTRQKFARHEAAHFDWPAASEAVIQRMAPLPELSGYFQKIIQEALGTVSSESDEPPAGSAEAVFTELRHSERVTIHQLWEQLSYTPGAIALSTLKRDLWPLRSLGLVAFSKDADGEGLSLTDLGWKLREILPDLLRRHLGARATKAKIERLRPLLEPYTRSPNLANSRHPRMRELRDIAQRVQEAPAPTLYDLSYKALTAAYLGESEKFREYRTQMGQDMASLGSDIEREAPMAAWMLGRQALGRSLLQQGGSNEVEWLDNLSSMVEFGSSPFVSWAKAYKALNLAGQSRDYPAAIEDGWIRHNKHFADNDRAWILVLAVAAAAKARDSATYADIAAEAKTLAENLPISDFRAWALASLLDSAALMGDIDAYRALHGKTEDAIAVATDDRDKAMALSNFILAETHFTDQVARRKTVFEPLIQTLENAYGNKSSPVTHEEQEALAKKLQPITAKWFADNQEAVTELQPWLDPPTGVLNYQRNLIYADPKGRFVVLNHRFKGKTPIHFHGTLKTGYKMALTLPVNPGLKERLFDVVERTTNHVKMIAGPWEEAPVGDVGYLTEKVGTPHQVMNTSKDLIAGLIEIYIPPLEGIERIIPYRTETRESDGTVETYYYETVNPAEFPYSLKDLAIAQKWDALTRKQGEYELVLARGAETPVVYLANETVTTPAHAIELFAQNPSAVLYKDHATGRILLDLRKHRDYTGAGQTSIHMALEQIEALLAEGNITDAGVALVWLGMDLLKAHESGDIEPLMDKYNALHLPNESASPDLMLHHIPPMLGDVHALIQQTLDGGLATLGGANSIRHAVKLLLPGLQALSAGDDAASSTSTRPQHAERPTGGNLNVVWPLGLILLAALTPGAPEGTLSVVLFKTGLTAAAVGGWLMWWRRRFLKQPPKADPSVHESVAMSPAPHRPAESLVALTRRSQERLDAEDFAAALDLSRQAVGINPNDALAQLQLGKVYKALGQYDEALAQANLVIQLDRATGRANSPRGYLLRSAANLGKRNYLMVLNDVRKARTLGGNPHYKTYSYEFEALEGLRRYAEAERALLAGIRKFPGVPKLYKLAIHFYKQRNQPGKAAQLGAVLDALVKPVSYTPEEVARARAKVLAKTSPRQVFRILLKHPGGAIKGDLLAAHSTFSALEISLQILLSLGFIVQDKDLFRPASGASAVADEIIDLLSMLADKTGKIHVESFKPRAREILAKAA